MFNIAICDDCSADRVKLLKDTEEYFGNNAIECSIDTYETGKELFDAFVKNEYDLLLLDIVLGDFNGIKLAEKIRAYSKRTAMVFISDSREFALDGYSVRAFAYLLKPLDKAKLFEVLDKLTVQSLTKTEETVDVKLDGITIGLPTNKIVFVESNDKKLTFHLTDGNNMETKAKLDEYAVKLGGNVNFLRCHKSYLINMDYVASIKGNLFTLKTGESVPIPKDGAALRKKAYYDYIMSK